MNTNSFNSTANKEPSLKWGEDLNKHFPKENVQMADRNMRRCATLLIIREMPNKTKMRYHLTPVRMAIIKETRNNKCWWGCGHREYLCSADRNVNWCSHYGKRDGVSLENWKLPCDPAIPLLSIYPKKTKTLIQKIHAPQCS